MENTSDSRPLRLPSDLVLSLLKEHGLDADFRRALLEIVCPGTTPPGHELHLRLAHFHRMLGFCDEATNICAAVWGDAMESLDSPGREADLMFLVEGSPFDFFIRLRELPEIISRIDLSASFAIPWFQALRRRIGNDMAQGGFWAGLKAWAVKCPQEALKGIGMLLNSNLDEDQVAITAQLLSGLRHATSPADVVREFRKLEIQLKHNPDVKKRVVYQRSWIDTAIDAGLDDAAFDACLEHMSAGSGEEVVEFFRLLYCVLHTGKISKDSKEKGVRWLAANTSAKLGDIERHFVIGTVNRCWEAKSVDLETKLKLRALTIQAQPISAAALGTWMELDQILASSLKVDIQDFAEFFGQLLDANPVGLRDVMSNHQALHLTKHALHSMGSASICAPFLVSPDLKRRVAALALYNEIPFSKFPEGFLDSRSDDEIALIILQTQVSILRPNLRLGFLLSLLERIGKSSPDLTNLYKDELSYQAKNLPGMVLGGLKEVCGTSPLLQEVVGTAEAYFDGLRKVSRSEIGVMRVPGLNRGRKLVAKRQSKLIAEQVEEGSVFLKHIKKSYLIYGSKGFCHFSDGHLTGPTPFQRMSTSTELPNLDLMASEELEMRHRNALLVMQHVRGRINKGRTPNES